MILKRKKRAIRKWDVFTDGAIRPELNLTGLSVVVYDESGAIALWWYRTAGGMTCNEAEYTAAIYALDQLMAFRPLEVSLFSDSQILVQQMRGEAAVRAPALRQLHHKLRERVMVFDNVAFTHVPRENNRVADALANEAIVRELKLQGGKEI